jgi:N6-L-threonylcarbamoyladenine synthase
MRAGFRVLGIESTCDETAAAVVETDSAGRGAILSNAVLSQIAQHAAYGGVVPEIAARAHIDSLDKLIRRALDEAGCGIDDLDAIAAAAGPGLIGGVMVGLTTGKAIALAANKPFVAVNHLEAHALTPRLTNGIDFPYLLLLVSGGHSQLVAVNGVGDYSRLGSTVDDALGEALSRRPARRTGRGIWRSRAIRLSPPDVGAEKSGLFLFRPENGGAARGPTYCPLDRRRHRRSLRLLPGGRG